MLRVYGVEDPAQGPDYSQRFYMTKGMIDDFIDILSRTDYLNNDYDGAFIVYNYFKEKENFDGGYESPTSTYEIILYHEKDLEDPDYYRRIY